jgi:hypothetical protein
MKAQLFGCAFFMRGFLLGKFDVKNCNAFLNLEQNKSD